MSDDQLNQAPRKTLATLRLLWAVLLLGQVAFGIITLLLVLGEWSANATRASEWHGPLAWAAVTLLAVLTPAGLYVRNQCYKARWEQHAVTPAGYFKGNVILLAMLEGVSTFAIVVVLVTGRLVPSGVVAVAALLLVTANYPTGKPMRPHRPPFAPS